MKTPQMLRAAKGLSPRKLGALVLVGIVIVGLLSFQKVRIGTLLSGDEEIKAEFSRHYKLKPYASDVKLAGVGVGTVSDVEKTDRGTFLVTMKLREEVKDKLGSQPSAAIRPTLVVGGIYYVALTPGGRPDAFADGPIPASRTSVPVELDRVLSPVTPQAKSGLRTAVSQTDAALRAGGREAVKKLLRDAPGTLEPAGEVLESFRGTRPDTDLTALVTGLESTAATLTRNDGQLASIFDSFRGTTAAFAAARQPLARAVADGPRTLRVTRAGLADLQPTLDRLTDTAGRFRSSARELDPLLADLDPILARTRPLVSDLRELTEDARPVLRNLDPAARRATGVMSDVEDRVMDRVNGSFKKFVLSPWKGTGPYANGGNSHELYKELSYLFVAGARVFQSHDANGSQGRLAAGVGGRTIGGATYPKSLEQYLEELFGIHQPPGPQEGKEEGGQGQRPIVEVPEGGPR
ncbi:MAG: MlaD family protein [Haloechinothrix sp.]